MDDMEDALLCVYNKKIGMFEEYQEPFAVVEYPTEKEFEFMKAAVEHYKKHRWVSVKDRLPEDEEEVLIYEVGEMYIATYTIKHFFTDFNEDNVAIHHPSHWMSLPEPPEEG